MKNLDRLRKKIDLIDDQILSLLKDRSKIALDIGSLKNKNSEQSNLFRPERQVKILNRLFLKKNNLVRDNDILSFWREIFYHQTNLQGGIDFLFYKKTSYAEKKIIFNVFGNNIRTQTYISFSRACSNIKKNNNKLLILPYPGKKEKAGWWTSKSFRGLYVILAIPLIQENSNSPSLVVVSKNKPIIEGDNSFLYVSQYFIKNESLNNLSKLKSNYLYSSKKIINSKELRFLGAYPNLKI
ncbi:chorismate mutase [Alphaproteobacteria bacterium]|nr:chorismate mutase [Alphaproteobacteria bacterium]